MPPPNEAPAGSPTVPFDPVLSRFQRADSWTALTRLISILDTDRADEIADRLLSEFGSLNTICRTTRDALLRITGMTEPLVNLLQLQPRMGKALAAEKLNRRNVVQRKSGLEDYIEQELSWEDACFFFVLYLNGHHRLIKKHRIFRGTHDKVVVFPREIAKEALACKARGIITAHNRPHGVSEIQIGQRTFQRLKAATEMLGIKYLNHFLVTEDGASIAPYTSFS